MSATKYYTDGHAVKSGSAIYCVATDVPAAGEICNKLNTHAELLEALERVVSRIDQAVDHKIHTGRMEPIGALLSEIQDGARFSIESAKARN